MNLNLFFAMLGGLLVLAFVANRLARFTGVPDVTILMFTGMLIGPVLSYKGMWAGSPRDSDARGLEDLAEEVEQESR
jgi:Kef-type K+ transport system membrane component KefB